MNRKTTPSPQMSRRFWMVGFACHMALVSLIALSAYLGRLPDPSVLFRHYDLVGHAVLIGMLAFFLDGALRFRPVIPGRPELAWIRLAPTLVLTLAGIEEVAQSLSPHRSSSLWDFAADALGVVLCSQLALWVDRHRRGRASLEVGRRP